MKLKLLALSLILNAYCFSQATLDQLISKVAEETCEYLSNDELKGLKGSALEMKLGVFLLQKYNDNREAFQAVGYDWDLTDNEAGHEFGTKVGLAMASNCPEALIAMAASAEDDDMEGITEEGESFDQDLLMTPPPPPPPPSKDPDALFIVGKLDSVTNGPVTYFTLVDNSGVEYVFVIVNQFMGKELLSEAKKGKNLKAFYEESFFYSLNNGYVKQKEVKYLEEAN